jgi:hypothetical protein
MKEIEIVNICDLLGILFPGYWDNCNFTKYDYEETRNKVVEWCEANDSHYYARGRENFFIWEACNEAEALGKSKVVVEDLS